MPASSPVNRLVLSVFLLMVVDFYALLRDHLRKFAHRKTSSLLVPTKRKGLEGFSHSSP